jgi:hypothetical protein
MGIVLITGQMLLQFAMGSFKSANITIGSSEAITKANEFKRYLNGNPMFQPAPVVPQGAPLLISLKSPSPAKIEVDTLIEVNNALYTILKNVCDAISACWQNWQNSATFQGVLINGPVGLGMPGCLVGTGMEKDMILMQLMPSIQSAQNTREAQKAKKESLSLKEPVEGIPSSTRLSSDFDFLKKHYEAIASALASAWEIWQSGYQVTLSYPAGAACSLTLPPTPNLPVPLAAGFSPADVIMIKPLLKLQMDCNYTSAERHPQITDAIFTSIASAFDQAFTLWKAQTQITNVMGAGGVAPAPPLPPGPVAGAVGTGGKLV